MNPALIERLLAVARAAEAAGHGNKIAVYQKAADDMGISLCSLQRKLKEVAMTKQRKKRSDAGTTGIPIEDLRAISGYLTSSSRNNGKKRLASIEEALDVLRRNGEISAARVDTKTGEVIDYSESAVTRALLNNGLHPNQQSRPTPKVKLASKHPNHVWQIDPSLCVLYYLPTAAGEALQVMGEKEFYKNKPANIRRIEKERVWRYVITDHTSGWIYVHYVLGAESGQNLCDAFINAMQKRHPSDPVNGVPLMVMVDPGSANTGAVFKNLCRALNVHVQVNQPGQPWAKGQVENANNLVECHFEHRLKFVSKPPTSLEEINEQAWAWMRWFNSTKVHSRTKDTRYNTWLKITAEQLRFAPSEKILRELAVSAPVARTVTAHVTVLFNNKEYDVSDVPNVMIGEKLLITRNPWREDDSAQVMYVNEEGRDVVMVIEADKKGEFGFTEGSPVIGDEYKAKADTRIDTERKNVERLVMDAATDEEAKQNRKAKKVPFGGRIDPMKPITDTPLPDYITKRGTASDVQSPVVQEKAMTHVAAAKKLATRTGAAWNGAEHFAWLKQRYPAGVMEEEIPAIEEQLKQTTAAPLRVVK